ncbi:SipW-dependent-type signal peptide-containing protein [Candidatus Parcubacteria bacterium]|nr:SipW-dependent-type signal peptide-containing protein [Candidatus Parcubacteria bacterium]
MNKKILISLTVIAVVAVIGIGGTVAYFSDTETSTGNVFTAGGIDLKIDYDCYFNKVADGTPNCPSWDLKSLTTEKFFDFDDIKPGDFGEGTISFHVFNNDAWGAFTIDNIVDLDNDITEPEDEVDGLIDDEDGTPDGDLDDGLEVMVWLDHGCVPGFQCPADEPRCQADTCEGDNVWQGDCWEPALFTGTGTQGPEWINVKNDIDPNGETWAMSDAIKAVFQRFGGGYPGITEDGRLEGSITYYIGVAWTASELLGNIAQTDTWGADLSFEVTQARNQVDPY